MTKRTFILTAAIIAGASAITSCGSSREQDERAVRPVVPVTVTTPRTGPMAEYTELMATSSFQVKTVVKSPVTGYVESCFFSPGDRVIKNQVLFKLRTKESAALNQDTLNPIRFKSDISVPATMDGVVATIDHPQGDFVQEGDAISTLVVPQSLVFLLDVPYEMKSLVRNGDECRMLLPDNSEIMSSVKSVLPAMSGASQTLRLVLQPRRVPDLPENLVVRVKILRSFKHDAVILPKSCILNDEVMKEFWVMKLINDTMAVKIPVETGLTGNDSIEVVFPVLNVTDRILSSGNYGLGDTAIVRILRHE